MKIAHDKRTECRMCHVVCHEININAVQSEALIVDEFAGARRVEHGIHRVTDASRSLSARTRPANAPQRESNVIAVMKTSRVDLQAALCPLEAR